MMNSFLSEFQNFLTYLCRAFQDWGSLHPLVIHFPLVLLTIIPFMLFVAFFQTKNRMLLFHLSFIFLLIGTVFIFLAVSTGNTASEHIQPDLGTVKTLDNHVRLAELARLYFSVLTGLFFIFLGSIKTFQRKISLRQQNIFLVVFLLFYMISLMILLNTARYGGQLVHQHGLTSRFYLKQ